MNAYDFDKTIFIGDTEDYFFDWLFGSGRQFVRKHRWFYRLNYRWHEFLCRNKRITKTKARQADYRILKEIEDIDTALHVFWDEHEQYVMPWYRAVMQPDDLIATGTPKFLMEPIMQRLGLQNLIATEMDRHTGRIPWKFLGGALKLEVFRKQFPHTEIDIFYSDTYSDHFLADVAREAYIIRGNGVKTQWDAYFAAHPEEQIIEYIYE